MLDVRFSYLKISNKQSDSAMRLSKSLSIKRDSIFEIRKLIPIQTMDG